VAEPGAAEARCPRCGGAFHCGVADEQPCWCTALHVAPERLAALARAYAGCLCPACLAAEAAAPAPGAQ
jgi:ribosomal protein L34E